MDIHNPSFGSGDEWILQYVYINGELEAAEHRLSALKRQYKTLQWSSLEQKQQYEHVLGQERGGLFTLAIWGLILITGIGWVISMKHILESHSSDYMIFRVLGFTPARLTKIILYQLLFYLLTGLLLGAVCGSGLTLLLWRQPPDWKNILYVVGFMSALSLFLIPVIRKIAWKKDMNDVMRKENEHA